MTTTNENQVEASAAGSFPTIFSDGILNLANSFHVVKFYLGQNDPSYTGTSSHLKVAAQIVMPMDSFIASFIFLENAVENLKRDGFITEDDLTSVREAQTNRKGL